MKNLTYREKVLLVILLIAGIGYLYYTFLLNPMLDKINSSKQTIAEYNSQLGKIQNVIATNEQFKKDYDKVTEKYNLYIKRMPYSYRDPEIDYNLNDLVKKSSSEIKSINFSFNTQPFSENDKLVPIPVNVNIESEDYEDAINLVKLIEADTRMVQIKSLSMASAADQNNISSGIVVNLGLEYYYVNDDNKKAVEYNFNNGSYGKSDLFN